MKLSLRDVLDAMNALNEEIADYTRSLRGAGHDISTPAGADAVGKDRRPSTRVLVECFNTAARRREAIASTELTLDDAEGRVLADLIAPALVESRKASEWHERERERERRTR